MSDKDRSGEFISEAQEVVEAFARNLLEIEEQERGGGFDPDLLNAAFRAIHSLKGMAGMFGAGEITAVSHALESTMDSLRLGKIDLSRETLDVLFESVEVFQRLLTAFQDPSVEVGDIAGLVERIEALSQQTAAKDEKADLAWLDESILGVLTEYEEHRLRENLRSGRHLYRVHASFDLLAIDVGIEALKKKMKSYGEVITYLPSADGSAEDRIDLDILVGSRATLSEIAAGVAEDGVSVHELSPHGETEAVEASGTIAPQVEPPSKRSVPEAPPTVTRDSASDPLADELSLRSLSQTVRVDLHRLDHLMNLVGELNTVQANLGGVLDALRVIDMHSEVSRDLQMQVRAMTRKLSLLQQGLLDVRMVPLGQVFDKLARVVRKLGREAGKEIRLSINGSETELDKLIVEELSDPLMHMVRNCIDHGIEPSSERVEEGKQAAGRIDLRAFQKGNRVVIEVEDDGRGIDWREVRDVAKQRKLIDPIEAEEITPEDSINLIFAPGFSTRAEATEISGRGVGMDVVKTNISRLSGMIDVDTQVGRGTRFSVTLPVTLAIIQALVIACSGQTFCIPLNSVLESIMVQRSGIVTVEGHEVISLRGRTLPLLQLASLFELDPSVSYADPQRIYVVIVGLAQHRVGLVVDDLLGQHDVVIKPLGSALRQVPGIAGATELGANRTVLLLDVATLVAEAMERVEAVAGAQSLTEGMPYDGA